MKINKYFLLALPFYLIFIFFFIIPLILTIIVSFWDYTEYSIIPDFIFDNYKYIFNKCFEFSNDLCVTFKTYLSTFYFCFMAWFFTLIIGFTRCLFFSISCQISRNANRLVFNLYNSILDFKCNKNDFMDTTSWKKWFIQFFFDLNWCD